MTPRLVVVLALACTPTSGPTRPAPSVPDAPEPPAGLSGLIEPWHPFDPQLAESAPVWLVTRYQPGTYPCRPDPDGSLEILVQDRFTALQVVRGTVRAPGVDLDLYALRGPSYPRAYAEERRYLLLLRPGPRGQALLADPQALGGMHERWGPDEVLAVIDLDQSEAEAAAEQVPASRSGEFAGGRWDPARWAALRASVRRGDQKRRAPAGSQGLLSSSGGLGRNRTGE